MALDNHYFVTSDLRGYFVNRNTGEPLSGGILTFYRDSARTVLKDIYQLTGSPPNYIYTLLPNPLTLDAVGMPQNAAGDSVVIFYYPWIQDPDNPDLLDLDLYYVTAVDQNFNPMWSEQAWPNLTVPSTSPIQDNPLNNQISNPTFTNILINSGIATIFTVSGSDNNFPIGPDWFINASGSGSITVQQIAVTGNDKIDGNPPYVLDISVGSGITTCYLTQRFSTNSGLWTSTADFDVFLSGGFTARNQGGGTTNVSMYYQESNGVNATPILIVSGTVGNTYSFFSGSTPDKIPDSTNSDTGTDGYAQIYLAITPNSEVRISSIQLTPSVGAAPANVPIDLNSSNRNEAFQGDYYIPRLNNKTSASFLTGWDFTTAPFQFGASGTITNTGAYICDQTIAAKFTSSNALTFDRDPITRGLRFNSADDNAFYIMQYLSGFNVRQMLGKRLSVNIFGYSSDASVRVHVYLFRTDAATSFPTLPTQLISIDGAGGITSISAGWTQISRSNLNATNALMSVVSTSDQIYNNNNDYQFSGWQLTDPDQIDDTEKFAIAVSFASTGVDIFTTINSISLCAGDIPSRPEAQTESAVLRECQYYYEKNYPGVSPANTSNVLFATQSVTPLSPASATSRIVFPSGFEFSYNTIKRKQPILTLFNPFSGTSTTVYAYLSNGTTGSINAAENPVTSNWIPVVGTSSSYFQTNGTATALTLGSSQVDNGLQGNIIFNYTADARLGVT